MNASVASINSIGLYIGSNLLSKLCGTSTSMIDRYYTANTQIESMLNVLLKTGRTQLKEVS
jgi:hypothetical protein